MNLNESKEACRFQKMIFWRMGGELRLLKRNETDEESNRRL